jgi:Rho GTPase-activating protein 1
MPADRKKVIQNSKRNVFGLSLDVVMGEKGEKGIPRVVTECIQYIRQDGLAVEGVFRRSPATSLLHQAKDAYEKNVPNVKFETLGGVHTACVLLKLFFRELSEPIFPIDLYDIVKGMDGNDSNSNVSL